MLHFDKVALVRTLESLEAQRRFAFAASIVTRMAGGFDDYWVQMTGQAGFTSPLRQMQNVLWRAAAGSFSAEVLFDCRRQIESVLPEDIDDVMMDFGLQYAIEVGLSAAELTEVCHSKLVAGIAEVAYNAQDQAAQLSLIEGTQLIDALMEQLLLQWHGVQVELQRQSRDVTELKAVESLTVELLGFFEERSTSEGLDFYLRPGD